MRVLIGLHHVTVGGDTINAVELAARLNRRGHDASMFALLPRAGPESAAPLVEVARQRGVQVRTFPTPAGGRQRLQLVGQLARFAKEQRLDLVHSFGHQDTYYAFLATYGLAGVPLVVNDYGMSLTCGLPRRVPLIVGTRQVLEQGRASRPGPTHLVEPPVDLDSNHMDRDAAEAFRARFGVGDDDTLVVVVSRLARTMKSEGLHAAIDAVGMLAHHPLRLAIVGDGDARADLQAHADRVNAHLGCRAVVLTGWMLDPAPAYAGADIVLGMGHSGLRAMAFGKPLVVLGERGFAMALTAEAVPHVEWHGVYGVGDGSDGARHLADALRPMIADPVLRGRSGQVGRALVTRFGIDAAVERLEAVYAEACGSRSLIRWTGDACHLLGTYLPAKVRRVARLQGRPPVHREAGATAEVSAWPVVRP